MTLVRIMWRMIGALLIGSIVTLLYIQRDARFHEHMAHMIRTEFSNQFGCSAEGSIVSINFFDPEIVVKHPRVIARDGSWRWSADMMVYRFSWFDTIRQRSIPGRVYLHGYHAQSNIVDGRVALAEHIQRLAASIEGVPVTLKQVVIDTGTVRCTHTDSGIEYASSLSTEVRAFHDRWKAKIHVAHGCVMNGSETVCSAMSFQAHGEIPKHSQVRAHGGITGSIVFDHLDASKQQCFVKGTWHDDHGDMRIYTKDSAVQSTTMHFSLLPDGDVGFSLNAQAPLAYVAQLAHVAPSDVEIKGACALEASGSLFDHEGVIHGKVVISDAGYERYRVGNLELNCTRSHGVWNGECTLHRDEQLCAHGTWSLYESEGNGYIDLVSRIGFPAWPTRYWRIEPGDCTVKGMWRSDGNAYATFACDLTHSKLGTRSSISGACAYKDRTLMIQGVHDATSYMAQGVVFPLFRLHHFRYRDGRGSQVITMSADTQRDEVHASIEYPFFKAILDDYVGYRIPGKGKLKAHGTIHPWGLAARLWLEDAQIRLHDTYNFVRKGDVELVVDIDQHKVIVKNCDLTLQQGSLHSTRATCFWDASGVQFVHAPLLVDKVFLNIEKDLFAELSGSALVHTDDDVTKLSAHIVVDRGQLKRNIFSSIVHQNMTRHLLPRHDESDSHGLVYDVTIVTKQPLRVKTSFLQTDAHIDLAVQGTLDEPNISGTIRLVNGLLRFPYKPLYIQQGMIYFTPGHSNDPMIELHARGRVKRYSISMNVSGSLQHPLITFESTPPLSEEQIVTLLLAGSEEGSLRVVMPSLIMKNVQGLLFSSEHTPSKIQTYLNNILVPLRHVRLVPSFSDQTARGGFRWALEVDVSDRFHGVIQKNFSLSEDTRIEAEYVISDDMSIRGVKDERGDMGGELEMRWKF